MDHLCKTSPRPNRHMKCKGGRQPSNPVLARVRGLKLTKISALEVSLVATLIRCPFRIAELCKGFSERIANNEIDFRLLNDARITATVLLLTCVRTGLTSRHFHRRYGGIRLRGEMICSREVIITSFGVANWGLGCTNE